MFSKKSINKFLRRWGVELHGVNYIQSLEKKSGNANEFVFFLKACKGNNPVIFDVGANKGVMIKQFLNYFPKATIYAFEPIGELCVVLNAKYSNDHRVKIFESAISNEIGNKSFNINRGIDTSSFLDADTTGLNSDAQVATLKKEIVKTTTIDDISSELKLNQIDILKLDIQGGELDALKGAHGMIKKRAIKIIYLEAYFIQQYKRQPLFFDTAEFLIANNYVLQDIYNPIYGHGCLAWCDAVFILKN